MISITYLEKAINYWRDKFPSDQATATACKEVNVLADVYGIMIFYRQSEISPSSLTRSQTEALKIPQL